MEFIATVYTETGHYYIGPDTYANVKLEVDEALEGFAVGEDFYKEIIQIYVNEFDAETSMPAESDPVWGWSREWAAEQAESHPFTLDGGLLKSRKEAAKLVSYRLPSRRYSLEARKEAAAKVTSKDSGHDGCTVSYLVNAAYDILIISSLEVY